MARTSVRSVEAVEAAVKSILANLNRPIPVSIEEFRSLVTLSRVREFLGGGDRARLANLLKQTEAKLVGEARSAFHIPHAPAAFVQQCQEIWNLALSTARAELAEKDRACEVATQHAQEALANAESQKKMFEAAKAGHQTALSAYQAQIETLSASKRSLEERLTEASVHNTRLTAQLDELRATGEAMVQRHADAIDRIEERHAGERKQLMETTDQIRQSLTNETNRADVAQVAVKALEGQISQVERERIDLQLQVARLKTSGQPDT